MNRTNSILFIVTCILSIFSVCNIIFAESDSNLKNELSIKKKQVPIPDDVLNKKADAEGTIYYYAGAKKRIICSGVVIETSIHKPYLSDLDDHSLCELSVQSDDSSHTIEIGWTVDRQLNNMSTEPHLFIFYWVDGKGKCYNNQCAGWVQKSETYYPGMILKEDEIATFMIFHAVESNVWWVGYNNEWMGYYPDSLWNDEFKEIESIKVFGEISSKENEPDSYMGNGLLSKDNQAAAVNYLGTTTNGYDYKKQQFDGFIQDNSLYTCTDINNMFSFSYGGPVNNKAGLSKDCAGIYGGTAYIDNCMECVGGITGLEACIQDCSGVYGGSAYFDSCGNCAGGETGITPCDTDTESGGDGSGGCFIQCL